MAKHKIAVISDTHNKLRPEVLEKVKSCELTLHAGDLTKSEILEKLKKETDLTAVKGNCDREIPDLDKEKLIEAFGKKIYIVHNRKDISPKADSADIIIYGHSHRYDENREDGKIYLNPGSAGPRRFGLPASMAIVEIDTDDDRVNIEKIDLDS